MPPLSDHWGRNSIQKHIGGVQPFVPGGHSEGWKEDRQAHEEDLPLWCDHTGRVHNKKDTHRPRAASKYALGWWMESFRVFWRSSSSHRMKAVACIKEIKSQVSLGIFHLNQTSKDEYSQSVWVPSLLLLEEKQKNQVLFYSVVCWRGLRCPPTCNTAKGDSEHPLLLHTGVTDVLHHTQFYAVLGSDFFNEEITFIYRWRPVCKY